MGNYIRNIFFKNKTADKPLKNSSKLLVHLHIYYYNQVDYFITKLKNITNCDWDLYITVIEKNEQELAKFKQFKPDAHIIEVENIGYDILPFLLIIQQVPLDKYDYVLKLHTKRYINQKIFFRNDRLTFGFEWRNSLVDALIGTANRFKKNLKILSKNEFGMICNKKYLFNLKDDSFAQDIKNLNTVKKSLSISGNYHLYLAGTMFLMKADILNQLKSLNLTELNFEGENSGNSSTIAHGIERIFTILTDNYGYKIYPVNLIRIYKTTFLQNLFSIRNYHILKVVTIFGFKFKFKSKKLIYKAKCNRKTI